MAEPGPGRAQDFRLEKQAPRQGSSDLLEKVVLPRWWVLQLWVLKERGLLKDRGTLGATGRRSACPDPGPLQLHQAASVV